MTEGRETTSGFYFPPAGQGMAPQAVRQPEAVGLDPEVVSRLARFIDAHRDERKTRNQRWALWRNGYLVHVEGDFDAPVDVASQRKTWHAMIVGAALQQGRIPSLDEKISVWQTELEGLHAQATWRHVLTQSAGFDYPHGDHPAYAPEEMWTTPTGTLSTSATRWRRSKARRDSTTTIGMRRRRPISTRSAWRGGAPTSSSTR